MKPYALADLPPALQAQALAQLKGCAHPRTVTIDAPAATKKAPGRIRQNSAGLNKTEQAFFDYLKANGSNAAFAILPQSITLKLANGCRYTPDFVTVGHSLGLTAYEVKGFLRDDAAVKLKVAASAYPWIDFFLVTRKGGDWQINEVFP